MASQDATNCDWDWERKGFWFGRVRKLFTEKLQLDYLKIELDWAHRTVKPTSSEKPRSIVVRFPQLKDKLAVLDKAKNPKGFWHPHQWGLPWSCPAKKERASSPNEGSSRERWYCIFEIQLFIHLLKTHHNRGRPMLRIWLISLHYLTWQYKQSSSNSDWFIHYLSIQTWYWGITYDASKPTKKG